jgi:hypothetical protein
LDNDCFAQETSDWANQSNQFLVFLKLEFAKAFVKVGWDFMYLAMEKMGMAKEFINTVVIRLSPHLDLGVLMQTYPNVADLALYCSSL